MAKTPKQKQFKSKAGNNYTFQTVLPSIWLDVMDNMTDENGKRNRNRFYGDVLDKIVAQPSGMKVDDFETYEELDEVVTTAVNFQQGK